MKRVKINPIKVTGEIKVGTWNIQTINTAGKADRLFLEAKKFELDLLGIQETRWKGEGRMIRGGWKLIWGGGMEVS